MGMISVHYEGIEEPPSKFNRSVVVNDGSVLTDCEDDENHLSGLSLPPKPGKILYPYFILLEIQPIEISQRDTKRRTYF